MLRWAMPQAIPMKRILLYSPVFLAAHRLFIAASFFVVPGRR